ncbi:metal ABC transporter solute-binding protein, Zn/Mn family [Neosynechococcus sphagnicola]|uniref:metal ABC transporter solute-binding protein, Zn/Mn family n=1 Tax=Neosynechococcus sphagnicola TaxID=1501145 RepID=UPI000AF98142|nr:zinc ABC transporter substrate-binding protein [Neosynechococcus sphagnicola]
MSSLRWLPWKPSVLVIMVSFVGGCHAPTPQATGSPAASPRLQVVVTTSVLCGLTQEIAQGAVALNCLVKPGTDPHVYQPTPEDRKAIETAALILYGGYNFEPSLIKLVKATSNPAPKVAVGEVAVPQPLMFNAADPDPHVWHNAQNGVRMVAVIQTQLTQLDQRHKDRYRHNAQVLTHHLTQLDTWIRSQIATIPVTSRKLITTHDALGYYAAAYGIPVEGVTSGD